MTISEAQELSIVGYLASIGIEPETVRGENTWYLSPLHPGERSPSFKVNTRLNRWKDFGIDGKGGDLVDLICRLHGVTVPRALLILAAPEIAEKQSFFSRGNLSENSGEAEPKVTILKVQALQNRALLEYLESRKISLNVANRYCKEVYYSTKTADGKGGNFFSVGFPNDSGGFELRNKYFKNCSSKDITTITGASPKPLSVFEGFFSYLSACEFYKVPKPAGTVVVLNSVSNIGKLFPLLSQIDRVGLYLDNDEAGQQAAQQIAKRVKVTNYSQIIHENYKDFNDFLTNKPMTK